MAAETAGFEAALRSVWNEDVMMRMMGHRRVEGLSFWVHEDWCGFYSRRLYNRPFTKKQHRAHVRKQRKLRWVRRYREVRRRLSLAWDGLRGREQDCW